NYDRIVEFGAELAGIRLLDRFVGSVNPIFRSSRLEIDMHYNPPGIRGEPRYLEGVAHFAKLHGSLDWVYQNGIVRRISVPFGAKTVESYFPLLNGEKPSTRSLMIYPNASKDRETCEYPYVELFRDLAAAICRPNSTVVLYGYGFGDEHVNRAIQDMLTIPSSHLVIIYYADEGDRIKRFFDEVKRPAQITLLIGNHFGDLKTLVDGYLPKPAIDRTTFRMVELLKSRGLIGDDFKKKEDSKKILKRKRKVKGRRSQ
ncbi:MAG: SIR2 family protein, partial [Desulfobacterales bacterium]|nr:SIR2 family protein [Desulfobacterales bacterium]